MMLRHNIHIYIYIYIYGTKHPTDTNAIMYVCTEALRGVKAADTAWQEYGNMEHCIGNTAI